MRAMFLTIANLAIFAAVSSATACERETMQTERIVSALRSEITLGMNRADVEQRLASMPVTYTYVPRARLEVTSEAIFEGRPLSGRFDVITPHEPQFSYMKQAFIFIELDDREQVVNVRIQPLGFSMEGDP